jgi:hypothetical protein
MPSRKRFIKGGRSAVGAELILSMTKWSVGRQRLPPYPTTAFAALTIPSSSIP